MKKPDMANWDLGAINISSKDLQTALMEGLGVSLPPNIVFNKIHRFKVGDRTDLSGWILMPSKDIAVFGDWSTGVKYYWFAESRTDYKDILIDSFNKISKDLEAIHLMAANKCRAFFAQEYQESESDYIKRKQIFKADNCIVLNNVLHIPIYNWNDKGKLVIVGEQTIQENGEKKFSYGLKKKSSFGLIGELSNKMLLCEGYATACSLHLAAKLPVIIALDAGNIYPCVENILNHMQIEIIICADNDYKDRDGNLRSPDNNPGVSKALYTVNKFSPNVRMFYLSCNGTDANDYHIEFGLDKLKEALINHKVIEPLIQQIDTCSCPSKEKEYKEIKFPHFRGLAQDVFNYIYQGALIKRTAYAVASVNSFLGTLLAGKFELNGLTTNSMIMIIGKTGCGKNDYLTAPLELFNKLKYHHLNGGKVETDAGLLKSIHRQNYVSKLFTYDEAGGLLLSLTDNKNQNTCKMADSFSTLYTSYGKYYPGKTIGGKEYDKPQVYGQCFSPSISLLGAINYDTFGDRFTKELLTQGFGGRLQFYPDLETKDIEERFHISIDTIKTAINKIYKPYNFTENNNNIHNTIKLQLKPSAQKKIKEIINKYRRMAQEEINGEIYTRIGEILIKMIIIDHVSTSPTTTEINDDSFEFAQQFVKTYVDRISIIFKELYVPKNYSEIEDMILETIPTSPNWIKANDLYKSKKRRLSFDRIKFYNIIKSLEASGVIKTLEKFNSNGSPKSLLLQKNQ